MKTKLTLAFTLLSSVALAGTALADSNHQGRGTDGRDQTVDHRDELAPAPAYQGAPPVVIASVPTARGPWVQPAAPVIVTTDRTTHGPAFQPTQPTFEHAPPMMAARWDLLASARAVGRRGTLMLPLAAGADYDQLRVVASDRNLDIVAIELTYGRGRTELVRPQGDGAITLDLGRGKVRSIAVRYVSRGRAARDASIQLLAKAAAPAARPEHGGRPDHAALPAMPPITVRGR